MTKPEQTDHHERLQNALVAIRKLQARVRALEGERAEPVAVIGIACRFPGRANDPEAYWRLLREGIDAVAEVPASRFAIQDVFDPDPEAPGKSYSRWGGFIEEVDRFDPAFFGIAPREAVEIDPQHRILLQEAWAAVEAAGIAPGSLGGTRTGVFVGITGSDYLHLSRAAGMERLTTYHSTGSTAAFVAGRVAYALGLQGPAVAVDTACSSSLGAVHLACQSLRADECDLALAGGVNLMLTPEMFVTTSKGRMLSPRGRCSTFDAAADGFVRGEGCGVVVLKRLSRALRDGDPVLAVIRGSAMNQDGATSGITVPNRRAQEAVIRAALASAGVRPHEVQYVEAHGTGTSLGDPIEMRALGEVLGVGRSPDAPFHVGSVKTNLGHLEAASGVAGLIKVVLMLQHGEIAPHLHFHEPSPHIPWDEIPAAVPTAPIPWPRGGAPRLAGVSSFGASGTNVHVVLEEPPRPTPRDPAAERPLHLLALSGRTAADLGAQVVNFRRHLLGGGDEALEDLCFTANACRTHFAHRLAVVGGTRSELAERLREHLAGEDAPGRSAGVARPGARPRVAFLFTGQGAQYVGMGRGLYESEPVFRAAIERCEEILRPHLDRPLRSVLFPAPGEEEEAERLIHRTDYTQPAVFALQHALTELWRSWGVTPVAVLGHSLGEYAAACAAGVFTLEQGLALVAERGRIAHGLPSGGAMAAIRAGEDRVAEALRPHAGTLSIAALNGPQRVVVSGVEAALEEVIADVEARGIECRRLPISIAFHSHLIDPALDALEAAAGRVEMRAPSLRLVSNLVGDLAGAELTQPGYWRRHAREPVLFARGMEALRRLGCDCFVEIGPHPVLLGMGRECLQDGAEAGEGDGGDAGDARVPLWLPSLRRGREDGEEILGSLGHFHTAGGEVDWAGRDAHRDRRRVRLPTYPFQGERYWVEARAPGATPAPPPAPGAHPLLGSPLRTAGAQRIFEAHLGGSRPAYLADHRVHGAVVLPAAAYVEMAGAAAEPVPDGHVGELENLVLHEPLVLPEGDPRTVQTVVTPHGDGSAGFEVFALEADGERERWRLNASGTVRPRGERPVSPEPVSPSALAATLPEEIPAAAHYAAMAERGIDFGPTFRGVLRAWRSGAESLAEVRLPAGLEPEAAAYRVHPALLDACLQAVGAALPPSAQTYLPLSFGRVRLHGVPTDTVWSRAVLRPPAPDSGTLTADLQVFDAAGRLMLEVEAVTLRPAPRPALPDPAGEIHDWLYDVEWTPQPLDALHGSGPGSSLGETLRPARERAAALTAGPDAALLESLRPELDILGAAYAARALRALGWRLEPGERVEAGELGARLQVDPRYGRLLERLLGILGEDGVLAPVGGGWRVARAPADPAPAELLTALRARVPESEAELGILGRCGEALPAVLRGECDPLELLFPGGSLAEAERMYQSSPLTREHNALVGAAVASLVDALPADRPLRVLEVGGGTGGTTAHVLPVLPPARTDYLFTDVSPLFTERAKARFGGYPFLRTRPLDIASDPAAQGLAAGSFDLVVAANVLHATPDLRRTLRHVRELLAPGGTLVLLEGVAKQRFADLTVGLTDGWWCFADPDLRSYALVGTEQWLDLLRETGLEAHALQGEGPFATQAVLVGRAPAAAPTTGRGEEDGVWIILSDAGGVGRGLAERLRARGEPCILARPLEDGSTNGDPAGGADPSDPAADVVNVDPADPAAFRALVRSATGGGRRLRGVVHLWALDDEGTAGTAADLDAAQLRVTGGALHLVQALVDGGAAPRLWLVTRGVQPVSPGDPALPLHAPLWGLGKVTALEHPELRCVRVDLDPDGAEVDALFRELRTAGEEDQVALRGGGRYVARLVRRRGDAAPSPLAGGGPYRLCSTGPKVLDSLEFRPLVRRAPGAGEVEVEVLAAGLAFRDILNALGQYPGPEVPLGGEFAGVVATVGEGVNGLAVGDAVLGMAPGTFQSFVTARAELVARRPAGLGVAEAAALPSAFLTAQYALHHLARITAADRVLVHAGAGGVGMAAIQVARRAGAEVFATAGSPAKRALLASLGVRHVFDSRTLDFSGQVLRATGGRGVDVVLNSLADEFIPRSLECLAEGGRFVELGKRGIWDPARVAEAYPGRRYFVVDLAAAAADEPGLIRTLFREVLDGIGRGDLRPLPLRAFPLREAVSAFRYMAQARHVGKVVLTHERAPAIRADATYLVTGGLGGVGLSTARWLVEQGARHLVLAGRRPPSDAALAALAELERAGARVVAARTDVSRPDQVDDLLERIRLDMPPLRGVFHGALVLDDGALVQQSWPRFQEVFAARVRGAWLLHDRTADLPLDFFVLFSAAGAVLGSAGQANYTAANAFLDALAHHRRSRGVPGLSIQWGVWSEVGRAAELGMEARARELGIGAMTPRQAVSALEAVMRRTDAPAQVAVVQVDWPVFLKAGPQGSSPFFASVAGEARRAAPPRASGGTVPAPEPRHSLRRELEQAPPARRTGLLSAHVRRQVAKVLSLGPAHPLDPRQPLQELGLDSLMAVELRTLLAAGLELPRGLPATLAFDHPSIHAITGFLARELFGKSSAPAASGHGGGDAAEPRAGVAEIGAAEAEALLLAELEEIRALNH